MNQEIRHTREPPVFVDHWLLANPERYHPKSSPYHGLSIKEQQILARIRRGMGRPPRAYTKLLRPADREDYAKIFFACCQALIFGSDMILDTRLDRITVDLKLIYTYRRNFDKRMPRGINVAFDDWSVTVRFRVDKIINWLYTTGHSSFTAKELRKYIWAIVKEQEKVDWYNHYAQPISVVELYQDIVEDAKSGKIPKAERGRRKYRSKKKIIKEQSLTESENCETITPSQEGLINLSNTGIF